MSRSSAETSSRFQLRCRQVRNAARVHTRTSPITHAHLSIRSNAPAGGGGGEVLRPLCRVTFFPNFLLDHGFRGLFDASSGAIDGLDIHFWKF